MNAVYSSLLTVQPGKKILEVAQLQSSRISLFVCQRIAGLRERKIKQAEPGDECRLVCDLIGYGRKTG